MLGAAMAVPRVVAPFALRCPAATQEAILSPIKVAMSSPRRSRLRRVQEPDRAKSSRNKVARWGD
jgi:hypothetical protein